MRTRAAGLCAVLALASAASAQDVPTLIPAQPVAPTRAEQMQAAAFAADGAAVGIGSAACPPTEAGRRWLPDGSRVRALCSGVDRFRNGVDMPFGCSCYAAELSFLFGGCKAFFRPEWACTSCGSLGCGRFAAREYGSGFRGAPNCK